MKITKLDIESLRLSFQMMGEVAEQTINIEHKEQLVKHQQRLRKLHHLLLQCVSQGTFGLLQMCQVGIEDDSRLARAIRTVNPAIASE